MRVLVFALLASVSLQCTASPSILDGLLGDSEKKSVKVEKKKKDDQPLDVLGNFGGMVGNMMGIKDSGKKKDVKLPMLDVLQGGKLLPKVPQTPVDMLNIATGNMLPKVPQSPMDVLNMATGNMLPQVPQTPVDMFNMATGNMAHGDSDIVKTMMKTIKKFDIDGLGLVGLKKAVTYLLDILSNAGKHDFRAIIFAVLQQLEEELGVDKLGKMMGIKDFDMKKMWKSLGDENYWKQWLKLGKKCGKHDKKCDDDDGQFSLDWTKWPIWKLATGQDDHNDHGAKVKVKRQPAKEDSSEHDAEWEKHVKSEHKKVDKVVSKKLEAHETLWKKEDSYKENTWQHKNGETSGHGVNWEKKESKNVKDLKKLETEHTSHEESSSTKDEWGSKHGNHGNHGSHGNHGGNKPSKKSTYRNYNEESWNNQNNIGSNDKDVKAAGGGQPSNPIDVNGYADEYRYDKREEKRSAQPYEHGNDEEPGNYEWKKSVKQRTQKETSNDSWERKSWKTESTEESYKDVLELLKLDDKHDK
ncbi:hypothetical protein KM043_011828 [Ampulex compressa]|nr:hypothetical protein KM043_011828 [Ampulex compressa]